MALADKKSNKKSVATFCYQCVAGPDLMKVEVEDGVATRLESNYDIQDEHPGGGRVCVKAFGLIQKTYNPHRIKSPMKRTNPKKGRNEDPEFVPITWEEALNTVAHKMKGIIQDNPSDKSGYPRIAASFGGGGTPTQYMGTFPALLAAIGKVDMGFGAGQGVKCYHSEHLYGELWHRAFIVAVDSPHVNYILSCGHNGDAAAGVAGIWRHADARVRGMKRVQVEPHQSVTGGVAAEWIPIKPKTDAAFLYGVIYRIVIEQNWRDICDVERLEQDTNSPYLIGPNGFWMRDPETEKPLIFDLNKKESRPFDEEVTNPGMEGEFIVSGIEIGADEDRWVHKNIKVKTSFQKFIDHMREYTPEWAEKHSDVPAKTIRKVADEFVENACIGQTIEVEGEEMPYRPVAILLGKTVNNGWGGYNCCWARTMLMTLVGALEVPGGNVGSNVKLNRPADSRQKSAVKGPDGFMNYPFNETTKTDWEKDPSIRNAFKTLVPLAANSAWSPALGPAHLPWLFQKKAPSNWPTPTKPDIWFCYRTNPAISSWNAPEVADRVSEFPFICAFAYTMDETNHFADILLPEATDLESTQLIQIGSAKFVEQLWGHEGWAIRQPACDKTVDYMDMTDIATELAARSGLLEKYNAAINRGAGGQKLITEEFDYGLTENKQHSNEDIWDATAKAASHKLSNGEEIHDLNWFKENGYMLKPYSTKNWYLYPHMKKNKIRFELPYQERILRHGTQLARRLHETGIEWWDKQLEEYEALPTYESFPDIWLDHVREEGGNPDDYPFWAVTSRSMQYSWGLNAGIPIINEVAQNVTGHKGVLINRGEAKKLGISEGDPIRIESIVGFTSGFAVLREGVRPDTVVMIGQFDHWKTPFAKDLNLPSLNSLTSLSLSLTDSTGSGSDLARVNITKTSGPKRTDQRIESGANL